MGRILFPLDSRECMLKGQFMPIMAEKGHFIAIMPLVPKSHGQTHTVKIWDKKLKIITIYF